MSTKTADLLEKSCFCEVPFHPVPRSEHIVWAGSEETRERLLRLVEEVRHDNVELSHLALVYGEYGSGKTHALKYLKSRVSRDHRTLSAYLEKPKVERRASFHGIAKEVISQIGERPLRRAVEPFVTYINEESKRLALDGLDPNSVHGSLDQHVKKRTEDFKRTLQEQINPQFPELLAVFEGLVNEDATAWRYFTGKTTAAALSGYGLNAPMEDDLDGMRALSGIYRVLTSRYSQIAATPVFDAAYLFIDELESVLDMKTDELVSLRAGFRDLFNACTEHFCLILAATAPNASQLYAYLDESLMVRITAEPIHISSHDNIDDGTTFICELMQNYRAGAAPTKFHPFTEDGLRTLVDRTNLPRTARKLITNCRRAWEQNAGLVLAGGAIGPDDVDRVVGLV